MNFINPAVLFGLIAASLPIILHILNLRKLKTIEFSSLQFLKEMQKNKIRRVKIKQILLLIIRTLILISIVLAFSRPTINGNIPGLEGSLAKSTTIILLDNSISMDYSDEKGNRLNQAKKIANQIINNLHQGDEVALIEMANISGSKMYGLSRNIDITKEAITMLKTSYQPADIDKSLKITQKLLEKAQNFNKNIFIISDAQPNIFEQTELEKITLKHTNIYLIPLGYNDLASSTAPSNKNLSMDSINIISQIYQIHKPTEIEAIVKNNSSGEIKNTVIQLAFNSANVAQRAFDINPKTTRSIAIGAVPNVAGPINACLQLENDAFQPDNKRYFGFIIPDKPNIALFSSANPKNDFINIALNAAKENFNKISYYDVTHISSIDLAQFNLIIVGNGNYNASDIDLLKQYIANGGNAMVFANNQMNNNSFADIMSKLELGSLELKEFSKTGTPINGHSQFVSIDKMHPLFAGVFEQLHPEQALTVESPKIYKAMPARQGQSIIDMNGGAFLTENIIGNGKLLYCAVSPDLEWSNFPVTGIFPTIIVRSALYLGTVPELSYNFEIGKQTRMENANIIIQKKFALSSNFKIVDPNGNEFLRQAAVLPSGAVLDFSDMNMPGVYTVYNPNNMVVAMVAMNLQKSESDFTKHEKSELLNRLEQRIDIESKEYTQITILNPADNIAENAYRNYIGTELWKVFIILAILLACAEMLILKTTHNHVSSPSV